MLGRLRGDFQELMGRSWKALERSWRHPGVLLGLGSGRAFRQYTQYCLLAEHVLESLCFLRVSGKPMCLISFWKAYVAKEFWEAYV